MKRKNFLVFSILSLFCVFGCGDEGLENVLHDLGAAPPAQGNIVTEVPIEIKEIIWGKDVDTLMAELENAIDRDEKGKFIDEEGRTVHDPSGIRAKSLIHQICFRREQEVYYKKYISAGGVAIMGNKYIDDRFFYAARDIVLGMTSKSPELRALLSPSRENRPGATQMDGIHDVTGHTTPRRQFRMILVHAHQGFTLIPEIHLGNNVIQYGVLPGTGGFLPDKAWVSVSGHSTDDMHIYDIFSHEFAHAIHMAIRLLDTTFDDRLEAAYAAAKENSSYFSSGDYAMRNRHEYWAESAKRWFAVFSLKGQEFLRDEFRRLDPLMYALLDEWFDLIYLRSVESRIYE